ncbi:MAG TPA: helix-turn-helix domain-containing protein [Gemmatimonadales bacterium]|nr:helix-turn-helix domain-containing protein [Gemmatimonadales bacterium]
MSFLDLTPFGFTPTESRVYEVLLSSGPGTGYAIARNAGLARANAYSALEGLVSKGAARVDEGRPKHFRPEPPATLLARITNDQALALEMLGHALEGRTASDTPTLVEITSPRAALQLLSHDIARATSSVVLLAPSDAYPILAPVLRRAVTAGLEVELMTSGSGPAELAFAQVRHVPEPPEWPGNPLLAVVDGRRAIVATRQGGEVQGHWSSAAAFVAATRAALARVAESA